MEKFSTDQRPEPSMIMADFAGEYALKVVTISRFLTIVAYGVLVSRSKNEPFTAISAPDRLIRESALSAPFTRLPPITTLEV